MRRTTAQALVQFLRAQVSERDGRRQPVFAGVFGIFGHGNVAGLGEALRAEPRLPYIPARNEQAMVHAAAGYARARLRLSTFACTTSVGPGATNMLTAAAGATINRLPVLLLPGDLFARRQVDPVLQQLESAHTQDLSVNDCFRPVSRYWDRIARPEQLLTALPAALRVLLSPAETGAVTLCLPQDVQAESWDFPEDFFEERVWTVARPRVDREALARAVDWIRAARRPLLVAGGGVLYSEAWASLAGFVEATGIPVGVTQAGKGALPYDHPLNLGALGVTGTPGANRLAREADLVIGVGTRWSDFTTASQTAFQDPGVRFLNLNVVELDAFKQRALPLVGDAREGLEELAAALAGWRADPAWRAQVAPAQAEWEALVEAHHGAGDGASPFTQAEVLGEVERAAGPRDVVVGAAGSLPGDLHKLWRVQDPLGYHVEYGYSCMGYEVAGGLGVRWALPDREVFVLVGDGSWLMMSSELVTALEQRIKLIVVLFDNGGYSSIGGLSESVGCGGFGTRLDHPVDFAANARSLGAQVWEPQDRAGLARALEEARGSELGGVIVVKTRREARVPGYGSWWDVPVAEVSTLPEVSRAREAYERGRALERRRL